MSIQVTPTRFELHYPHEELAATIEMFDAECSHIEIKSVVSPATWPELSDAICKALKQMHPEKQP